MQRAKNLYINEGKTGQEAAAIVGVSETNFYRWVRRYGWKEDRETKRIEKKILITGLAVSVEATLAEYLEFVKTNYPKLTELTETTIKEFLQQKAIL